MPVIADDRTLERSLAIGVAMIAGAMLLLEITLTRLFSVLFLYHYSFFAISLAMSGLTLGGIRASRWDVAAMSESDLRGRLAELALFFSAATFIAAIFMAFYQTKDMFSPPPTVAVLLVALIFVPGLTAAGAFLATTFAYREAWIGRLYASDLLAAASSCLLAIALMRAVGGAALLLAPVCFAAVGGLALAPRRPVIRGGTAVLAIAAAGGLVGHHLTDGQMFRLQLPQRHPR
jgi:hypothetical protein